MVQPACMGGTGLTLAEYQLVGVSWLWLMWGKRLGGIAQREVDYGSGDDIGQY